MVVQVESRNKRMKMRWLTCLLDNESLDVQCSLGDAALSCTVLALNSTLINYCNYKTKHFCVCLFLFPSSFSIVVHLFFLTEHNPMESVLKWNYDSIVFFLTKTATICQECILPHWSLCHSLVVHSTSSIISMKRMLMMTLNRRNVQERSSVLLHHLPFRQWMPHFQWLIQY